MSDVVVEDDRGRKTPVVNPLELPQGRYSQERLYRMWAGQTGTTFGYVWADSYESAFEEWVEYLDENAPGHLVTVGEDELKEAAEDLGIEWEDSWPDWSDPEFEKVVESAEADLTPIGHTTLKGGTHIPSYEWGLDEIEYGAEFDTVWQACAETYETQYDELPEPPRGVTPPKSQRHMDLDFDEDEGSLSAAPQRVLPSWARPPRRR